MIGDDTGRHPILRFAERCGRERVTHWLSERVDVVGELDLALIAGGHSNLTFSVSDQGGHRWVLRRPPLGHVLATAHDMGREFRIISALAPTRCRSPPSSASATTRPSIGAPFYVMDFVDGTVVRDESAAASLAPAQRTAPASESLVDVLARDPSIDVDAVGLGDLGRRDGYIERQLQRWYRQYEGSTEMTDAVDFRAVDEVHELRSSDGSPNSSGSTIVHGDYRLDNCIVEPEGTVVAVLDWELCTLGDPLADVGLLWVYWTIRARYSSSCPASPTALDGFADRGRVLDRYAAASGRDVDGVDYYVAFGYWKLTCIIAGVYTRYADGVMGEVDRSQVDGFATMVHTLADLAAVAAGKV